MFGGSYCTANAASAGQAAGLRILLRERMEALGQSHTLQIFATDIDSRAT